MMQQLSTFFSERAEEIEVLIDSSSQAEMHRKIKSCSVCKVQKCNHIVREYANTASASGNNSYIGGGSATPTNVTGGFTAGSVPDQIRQEVLNLAPREVIEQVIFDPQHGIVKREIHFGIIDYLTVSAY